MSDRLALVVDDHPTNRLLASAMLGKLGWTTEQAESGEVALNMVQTRPYRVILLDISMPGLTGEETCAKIRAIQGERALCIIAYTAHAFPEERDRFLACGFDDILVKPINRQRLEALLAPLVP